MRTLSIGSPYDPGQSSYEPHAAFDMIREECTLDLFWKKLTPDDVARIACHKAFFGIWYSENNDVFLLYRFGTDPWADTVFSMMQLPPSMRFRPVMKKPGPQSLTMHVTLVACETGLVKAKRDFVLPAGFSRKVFSSVSRQYSRRYITSWSPKTFVARCCEVYARYPDSAALLHAPGCTSCCVI